jgi:hypothetical protein
MGDDVVVGVDEELETETGAIFEAAAEAVVEGSVGEGVQGFFLAGCSWHGYGIRVARLLGSNGFDAGNFVCPRCGVIIG